MNVAAGLTSKRIHSEDWIWSAATPTLDTKKKYGSSISLANVGSVPLSVLFPAPGVTLTVTALYNITGSALTTPPWHSKFTPLQQNSATLEKPISWFFVPARSKTTMTVYYDQEVGKQICTGTQTDVPGLTLSERRDRDFAVSEAKLDIEVVSIPGDEND
jgi:hypothetical protein